MDQNEAINLFVSKNFKLFLNEPFLQEIYKETKRSFFLKNQVHRVPKDKLIAEHAINYLVKHGLITDEAKLEEVFNRPFFKSNIYDKDKIRETLRLKKTSMPIIDPKKIVETRYRERVVNELTKQIIEEKIDIIDKAIEQKKEEYDMVPSILDGIDIVEPSSEEQEVKEEQKFLSWWRQLQLSQDPFPTQEGLSKLADDLYEKIVIKTPLFEKYVYIASSEPTELFKDTIFFGWFGSGKTTLFDYLKKPFLNERVFTIYIQLYAEQSFSSLFTDFRKKFYEGLCEKHELIFHSKPQLWLNSNDYQECIDKLLVKFSSNADIKGFIVIIDDLHKDFENFELAMKFVNNLQIFRSELNRKINNFPLCFFIAGSDKWEEIIKNDPKYSGSYARQETMPPVTEQTAYEMLNKRLEAFATTPDTIRTIDMGFVKRIHRGLTNNHVPITFRSFIKATLSEFENGNFSILTVDPVHISKKDLADIKNQLESNDTLRKKFSILLYSGGIQKEEHRQKALELLKSTYLKNGISEDTMELRQNRFFFQRLVKSQLIQKSKLIGQKFKWVICQELEEQNRLIYKKWNLSLEDYLTKIYVTTVSAKTKKTEKTYEDVQILDSIVDALLTNPPSKRLAKDCRSKHLKVMNEIQRYEKILDFDTIINDCVESLALLTKSLALYLGLKLPLIDSFQYLVDFWREFWKNPSEISEFLNQVNTRAIDKSSENVFYICSLYSDAFSYIVKFFHEETDKSRYLFIPYSGLSNLEIAKFHEIRDSWSKNQYFDIAKQTSEIVQKKLRTFLFNIFTLLYGDRENRLNHLDSTSANYIRENLTKDREKGYSISNNEFEQINRGNYKNFMIGTFDKTTGKQNWERIFKNAFSPMPEIELKYFLDIFAELDLVSTHLKEGSITGAQQNKIYSYVIKSIEIVKKMNSAYQLLVQKGLHSTYTSGQLKHAYYFSFDNFKDKDTLSPIYIKVPDAERITEQIIREKPVLIIDLEDTQAIESRYAITYREFIAMIAILMRNSQQNTSVIKQTNTSLPNVIPTQEKGSLLIIRID